MSYTLEITKTPINIPSISGDLVPDDLEGFMPSSRIGSPYIVDLLFQLTQLIPEEGEIPVSITSVSSTTPGKTGVSFQVTDSSPLNYTIRVQGVINDSAFNSTYNMVLQGQTSQTFIIQTNVSIGTVPSDFLAIFRWSPPSVFFYLFSNAYQFVVNPGAVSEKTETYNQYVYYDWNIGLDTFKSDLETGTI